MTPGAVVVWTDGRPRLTTHRIPEQGMIIDRTLIGNDPDLRSAHAHVELAARPNPPGSFRAAWTMDQEIGVRAWPHGDAVVELDGRRLTAPSDLELPAYLATGSSVIALVPDLGEFEHPIAREGSVVIGSALHPVVKQIDDAANAEDHLSLKGPDEITRALAERYGNKLGAHVWFRPGGDQHLDHFLSTRGPVRTVILELSRVLFEHDVRAIGMLLETDLRFVVVRPDDHYLQWLPPALAERTIEVPRYACDERVVAIADRAKDRRLRAPTVAGLLDLAERLPEERWNRLFDRVLDSWNDATPPQLETILLNLR